MTLFLSRVQLRSDASVAALAPLLQPGGAGGVAAAHHLLWSLFADGPERRRDFLWREEGSEGGRLRRRFLILSQRLPEDRHRLFEIESRDFDPQLAAGDRLHFSLRANPTVTKAVPNGRGRRYDPLAAALSDLSPAERALRRHDVMQQVGLSWIEAQAGRAGFALIADEEGRPRLVAEGDDWRILPRQGAKPITFSVLDIEGELRVEQPELFLERLARGFGRAKAFGCGLMLIRRA